MNPISKKTILLIQALLIILILLIPTALATIPTHTTTTTHSFSQTITIPTPQLTSTEEHNQKTTHIYLPDSISTHQPGQPNLPTIGLTLILPHNHQLTNIKLTHPTPQTLGTHHHIQSVPTPQPLTPINLHTPILTTTTPYQTNTEFPTTDYTLIGTYDYRGYRLLYLNLHPIKYTQTTGELTYIPEFTLTITTAPTSPHPLYRNQIKDYQSLTKKITNPSQLNDLPKPTMQTQGILDYDLLILTTREFKNAFQPLKQKHEQNGISVRIKTLNDIGLIPENVTPEDIRNYITKQYLNNNIDYVLIGGDADIIPVQKLYVKAWNGGSTTNMPSDLYYACLDGTYNYDEDNKIGEPTDGPNGNDVDLIAEIYIGRACVGNQDEANNFVTKTLTYLDTGGYDTGTVLLVGEHLWEGPDTWGGDYMEELIDYVSINGMVTTGLPSNTYTIDKLYDKTWNGNNWPSSEIKTRLNNGLQIVNHLGHSSYGYNMKLVNSDVELLTNEDLFFLYSQGCMAGGFDDPNNYDSIAEYFTIKTPYASFAAIMNARYGWGVVGSTNGASQRYHREFWDAIFGEHIPEIGKANQDSKEDNINRITGSCMRWCYYQLNLFGDPTLTFTTFGNNTPPEKPVRPWGVKIGKPNNEYTFFTHANDSDNDSLFYKWDWGDGTMSNWEGPYQSGEEITISHTYSRAGRYVIRVKCRDETRDESGWSLPYPLFMPSIMTHPILNWIQTIIQQIIDVFIK